MNIATEDKELLTEGMLRILTRLKKNPYFSRLDIENAKDNGKELTFLGYARREISDKQQNINREFNLGEVFSDESQDDLNKLRIYLQKKIDDFVLVKNKLTKELALAKVLEITELNEDESFEQDELCELYLWFIESVSNGFYGANEAQEIARIIRKDEESVFSRWYA